MRISELKDAYSGRAFILGNGPSLKKAPFDMLKREHTFAVNRIASVFELTDWRPTFYVMASTAAFDKRFTDWIPDIRRAMAVAQYIFACETVMQRTSQKYDWHYPAWTIPVHCTHEEDYRVREARDEWWSNDADAGVCKYGASLLAVAQIARYIGFDPLIFMGLDGFFGEDDHVTSDYKTEVQRTSGDEVNNAQRRAFQIVRNAGLEHGFETYLADISKGYGIFEKVSLDELL